MFRIRPLSVAISTVCAISVINVGHAYTYTYSNSNHSANASANTQTHTYSYNLMESFSNSNACNNLTTNTTNGAKTATISACPLKERNEKIINDSYVIDHYSEYQKKCNNNNSNSDRDDNQSVALDCSKKLSFTVKKLNGMTLAKAINNKGEVTGMIAPGFTYDGRYHAGIWRADQIVDLGVIGCRASVSQCSSQGYGINDRGQVVGESQIPEVVMPGYEGYWAVYNQHETLWNSVTPTLLSTLGTEWGTATDINNKGTIVGHGRSTNWSIFNGDYLNHAFVKQGESIKEIGGIGQTSKAFAINERDEVAGEIKLTEGLRAYRWKEDTVTILGHLGGMESIGRDIANNERAKVVGYSKTTSGAYHGFVWREGTMTDLGTLFGWPDSFAFAVNEKGQIVGRSGRRAVIWQDGHIFDLNSLIPADSGVILMTALDINERGQIIVQAKDGAQYLLTPSP